MDASPPLPPPLQNVNKKLPLSPHPTTAENKPGPRVPESPSPRVPESPSPRVPESPSPRVPESPSPRVPESPSPRVPESYSLLCPPPPFTPIKIKGLSFGCYRCDVCVLRSFANSPDNKNEKCENTKPSREQCVSKNTAQPTQHNRHQKKIRSKFREPWTEMFVL